MKSLRIYHSAVVSAWRARDRAMRNLGVDVTLVSPRVWNEGGAPVQFAADGDDFAVATRTLGRHPYAFVYRGPVLRRLLRAGAFDVIDVHEEPGSLAVAQVLTLRWLFARGTPVVLYTAQNLDRRLPPPFEWLRRRALRAAAAIYCVNEESARVLRRRGFTGRLPVLGLGVDIARFPSRDANVATPFHLGYVGRLEPHKGVDVLLRATALLPEARLTVVGAGPFLGDLVALAKELDLVDRVEFVGFVEHDALPDRYRDFDVVVVPSLPTRTWIEQFCRVAVEAMSAGVPVVASDLGSLPEVIGDGGLLVRPGDATALAEAMRSLFDDPDQWRALSARAKARTAVFDWAAIATRHVDLYREVTR